MNGRFLMRVLWPSFLMAGVTGAVVFALIDPLDIRFLGHLQTDDRQIVYAGGFFLFWIMAAISSALTLQIGKPSKTDRSPLFGDDEDD